ncbi:MAG: hypothetical protein HYZ85_00650 [Candidatus Omnitrophica bacterium]|nr:hypothetical protein [Candidatus Omnitrophota bacterium]
MPFLSISSIARRFFGPLFDVHPQERKKTILMFFYFFLTIGVIYILKPVRSSLFLTELGASKLRFVYMGEGVFLAFIVAAYIHLAKRIKKRTFHALVLGFFALNLIIFWVFFLKKVPYLSAFFYVWVASFSITMTTQFWTLANDTFNPIEAKRLFGLIASGGSFGGIFGGMAASFAVNWMRTEDLLLLAAVVVTLCLGISSHLLKEIRDPDSERESSVPLEEFQKPPSLRKIFSGSSYLIFLALLVIITKMTSTVVDNQFNGAVDLAVQGKEAKTAFFGSFMAWVNVVSFVLQLIVTSLSLRFFGVGTSLFIMPLGVSLLSAGTLFFPLFYLSLFLKLYDGSVSYSIQQTSKEVLFLPLSSSLRYRAKPMIDMLGFRVAKSLGGLYIALFAPLLGISDERLGLLILALVPFWIFVIQKMKGGYFRLLREHVVMRKRHQTIQEVHRATEVLSFLHDEKGFGQVQSFMNARSSLSRKLAAAAYLAYDQSLNDLESARKIVGGLLQEEGLGAASKEKIEEIGADEPTHLQKIEEILIYNSSDFAHKRALIKIIEKLGSQNVLDMFQNTLLRSQDHALRFVLLKSSVRMIQTAPVLKIRRALLKNEAKRELKIYEDIQKVESFYLKNVTYKASKPYLETALHALSDESLERLFNILFLLHPVEDIWMIYHLLIDRDELDQARPHALELLSSILLPPLIFQVQRTLESQKHFSFQRDEIHDSIRRLAFSADKWLSIFSRYLISEMKLTTSWPELLAPSKQVVFGKSAV